MLHGPEGAGAPDTGLDLVGDERDGTVGRDLPHTPQPAVRRGDHAALALDGFEDHPGGMRHARLGVFEDGLGPAGGEFGTAFTADAEGTTVVLRVGQARDPHVESAPGRFERSRGHPVVGAAESEDSRPPRRGPDQLEGGLHSVGTGRSAELHARVVGEAGRQSAEQLGDEGVLDGGCQVEDVQRSARVQDLADGFQDHGMVVPERQSPRTGEAVQVAAAVGSLDGQPPCPHRHDRQSTRVGACRRLTRRLAPQDPLVHSARPRRLGRIPTHRFGHGHGSLSSRCPGRAGLSHPRPTRHTKPRECPLETPGNWAQRTHTDSRPPTATNPGPFTWLRATSRSLST